MLQKNIQSRMGGDADDDERPENVGLCTLLLNISHFTRLYNLVMQANRNFFHDTTNFYVTHVPTIFQMLHRATGVRLIDNPSLTRFRPLTTHDMRSHLKAIRQSSDVSEQDLLDFFSKNVSIEIQVHSSDSDTFGRVWQHSKSSPPAPWICDELPHDKTKALLTAAFRGASVDERKPPDYLYLDEAVDTRRQIVRVCGHAYAPAHSGTTRTVHVVIRRDNPTACMAWYGANDRFVDLHDDETDELIDATPILEQREAVLHATRHFTSKMTTKRSNTPVRDGEHGLHARIVDDMRPISRCEAVADAMGRSIAAVSFM